MNTMNQAERVAFARLRALLELLPSELDKQMAPTGLTWFEFTLLEALDGAEQNRLRLTALASQTNATLPRLSRVVTSLARKGLVARKPCTADGRAINAVITKAGAQAFAAGRPLYDSAVRQTVLDGLDAEGINNLASITLAILKTIDPERRMAVTSEIDAPCSADPRPGRN